MHEWPADARRAREIQQALAARVSREGGVINPGLIAGVDVSVSRARDVATAAVVVLDYPALRVVEVKTASGRPGFPYIPGLLSFRELPLTLAACETLTVTPDLFIVDGQGIAHPRRIGLASHLGLLLDTPTIGCAKSLLCGRYEEPEADAGTYTELVDREETIGAALRTRPGVKPVHVSTGHKIDLPDALAWVLRCCRGYRLPEPTRLAHLAAGGNLRWESATTFENNKSMVHAYAGTE